MPVMSKASTLQFFNGKSLRLFIGAWLNRKIIRKDKKFRFYVPQDNFAIIFVLTL
jgi:hypothetical protein